MRLFKNKNTLELALVLLVFLAANILSYMFQMHISLNEGQSWDGAFYYQIASEIGSGQKISAEAPFVYRIGTPFLVGELFKDNILLGFTEVNVFANLLVVLLLVVWFRMFISDWRIRALMVILFITPWHGPVRFTYFDPNYPDSWMFVFLISGLIVIQRVKLKPGILLLTCLGVLTFIGVLFREVILIIPLALAFINNPLPAWKDLHSPFLKQIVVTLFKKLYYPFLFPFLLGIASFVFVHLLVFQTNVFTFGKTAVDWAYNKPLLTYLHGIFIAYGPLIILPIFFWKRVIQYLWEHQEMLIYLLGMLTLSWIGGSDTERFMFWAMPVVYLLIGLLIQENGSLLKSPGLVLLIMVSTVLSQRLFWIVADYPNTDKTPFPILTILSNHHQYMDLWSYFAARSIQVISLLEYLLLSAILIVWLKMRQQSRQNKEMQ